ncbi:glutamate receptor 2.1 [Cannabis sativa]|uniref:glutamate receptor 2.1 n=1 Tax=Cannabis sativa TaxID=3483 RepID=UPI0029CA6E60|nr:glutamate receptor 2.1 [Cannabis sativa]
MVNCSSTSCLAQNDTIPVEVGVVFDLETWLGKVWLSCIELGLSDFYGSHPNFKTRLILNIRDSKEDVVTAASQALDLIQNVQVRAILGPHKSTQAKFIIDLGQKAQVPIISFSATSPSLKISNQSTYFFRTATGDSSQVLAISSIVKAFRWRKVVPIYIDNEYGEGIIPYLVDALGEVNTEVPYRSAIPPSATDDQIKAELYKLNTMQTRVFVVHTSSDLGIRLFTIANKIGMLGQGYVWIITQDFANRLNSLNSSIIDSMEGVLGIKTFVPQSKELDSFKVRWKANYFYKNIDQIGKNPTFFDAKLNVMGFWAYDSVHALALAVEKLISTSGGVINTTTLNSVANTSGSTNLDSFNVSPIGPKLLETLSSTRFKGLAGDFILDNGQLKTPIFEIVNIVNGGKGRIGYWTQNNGLVRNLADLSVEYSTSKSSLKPILWPGESTNSPKGYWENPTNEKRLRIGIPNSSVYREFVNVINCDANTSILSSSDVIGFSIDVFKASVRALPYALNYDFYVNRDGSYDDLIYQVYLGKYDAVVADVTIRANRSQYVYFTLPYTESGVAMVVPVKDNMTKSAWVFLKPLTWDLWVTTFCFFLFIGFVVWVLEHRINEDFRGPPSHQIGTSFWFSFSTIVFAHKERVVSNLARFVVIVWAFVLLILTQSYAASLTSLLTVEQLEPTIKDINQILKSGERVGCLGYSFVYELLKQRGFANSQIVLLNSTQQCDHFLSIGSAKGGIAAYVDETPNTKIFLAQYCSKYTLIGPIFKTAGYGFAFRNGSPLAHDISKAILNVTEGDEMKKIENKWFMTTEQNTCLNSDPKISSNSLSLDNFWGLFLIAGVSSLSTLIIFAIMFLQKHKQIWSNSHSSIPRRIGAIFKIFDQKDLNFHTFKKRSNNQFYGGYGTDFVEFSANNTNCPPSPSTSNSTGSNSPMPMGEQLGTILISSAQASPPNHDGHIVQISTTHN